MLVVLFSAFTDPDRAIFVQFSIYQISWIKMKKVTFCKLKTIFTIHKHLRYFFKCIFTLLLQIQHENNFYLPVNTDKLKLFAFLVFVCAIDSFIV